MTGSKREDAPTTIFEQNGRTDQLTPTDNNPYVENHCVKFLGKIILFQFQLLGRQLFIWVGERSCLLENIHLGAPISDINDHDLSENGCSTCIAGDIDSIGGDLAAKLSKA